MIVILMMLLLLLIIVMTKVTSLRRNGASIPLTYLLPEGLVLTKPSADGGLSRLPPWAREAPIMDKELFLVVVVMGVVMEVEGSQRAPR